MLKFPIGAIIKTAWRWTRENMRLWWLGFFVTLGGFFMFNLQDWVNYFMNATGKSIWINLVLIFSSAPDAAQLIVTILVMVLFLLVFFWAKAALLQGLLDVKSGDRQSFKQLLRFGWHRVAQLLLLEVFLSLPNIVLLTLVGLGFYFSTILFFVAIILFFLYNGFIFLFRHFAYCDSVFTQTTAWAAVKSGYKLFIANWRAALLSWLVFAGLAFGIGFITLIALVLLLIPLVFIVLTLFLAFGMNYILLTVATIICLVILLCFLICCQAAISVFFVSYTTQVYWELKK